MIKVDFKKELESASKSMIMIHDPKLLIKLIIRMIVRKLYVRHAGMILFEPENRHYVLDVSSGEKGLRIPEGFTRFDQENPIIRLFNRQEFKQLTFKRNAIVVNDINKLIWRETLLDDGVGDGTREILQKVEGQMQALNAVACVPAYYQNKLMAVLLLGEKKDSSSFDQEELDFFAALASDAAMAIRNAQLFKDLQSQAAKNRKQFIQTIIVLSSAIEAKDPYTRGHTERVTSLALSIARRMEQKNTLKVSKKFFENLYIAGLLHDVGKIGVPENILNKTGKLLDSEFSVLKGHPQRGIEIVESLELPKECTDGILLHHERYDGKGYPVGLAAGQIPMIPAIISVADAYDAMTTNRSYRNALTEEQAIGEIKRHTASQFHPEAAKAFLSLR